MVALQIIGTEIILKEQTTSFKMVQKTNVVHDDKLGADMEALMPKLCHSDYYTEPRIPELSAKECGEPGFCRRVKDFVASHHNYGSIKFLGETDVRRLELESLIQFNHCEVIVHLGETKKPPSDKALTSLMN